MERAIIHFTDGSELKIQVESYEKWLSRLTLYFKENGTSDAIIGDKEYLINWNRVTYISKDNGEW